MTNYIDLPSLSVLTIGDGSFTNSSTFQLSNLNLLQSLNIGWIWIIEFTSITIDCYWKYEFDFLQFLFITIEHWEYNIDIELTYYIDLPSLSTLTIGDGSFTNSSTFQLSNLNLLQSLNIGNEMSS